MELTTLNHYNRRQFELMATKCQTNADTLQLIVYSQNNRIKELFEQDEAGTRGQLQQIIFGLAETYTTARLTTEEGITENARIVLSECMNLLITKFKLLGIPEIQEAFRQAAAGEINADLNAWNGKFTVSLFGGVLTAYKKKRAGIRQKLEANIQLIQAQKDDEQKAEKNKQTIQEVIDAYKKLLEQAKEHGLPKIEEIPVYYGRILADNGVLNISSNEKATIYKEAKQEAIKQLKSGIKDTTKNGFERNALKKTLKTVLDHIIEGNDAGDIEQIRAAATVIFKKRVVLRSLCNDLQKWMKIDIKEQY